MKKLNIAGAILPSVIDYANNHGHGSKKVFCTKKEQFIAWLQVFSERVGDFMPDEECIVLPYPKFEGVYLEYKQEMDRRDEESCQYSYCCRM